MTDEQAMMLARIEQQHGRVLRIPDEQVEELLANCVTDTRVYGCTHCRTLFSIEPDGEVGVWEQVPFVD